MLSQAHGTEAAKKSRNVFLAHTRGDLSEKPKDPKDAVSGLF
jgi:hypothetical protein